MDVREDTDDDWYEDAREENEEMRGSPSATGCEKVMSCNTEVKDGCYRRKESNPLPFPRHFHLWASVLSSSVSPLNAATSWFCDSLSHILHHTFLHPEPPYRSRKPPVF